MGNNIEKTTITRIDEEKFLKLKIAENIAFKNPLTYNDIIEHIEEGSIPLEVSDDDGTRIIDESCIEEIEKVMPSLLKIVDKPRSFIRSLEEKVEVETAKRINHKAIFRLSRDSNDWYSRTILSVKPKNILSDINEETIDLYENRFVCSLVDKISNLLVQARQFYLDQIQESEENTMINEINKEYGYDVNFSPFFSKVDKKMYNYGEDTSFSKKVKDELKRVEAIEKKIMLIKHSDFYKTLHKKRKVVDPIQKTNILMFEFKYNQAYKLWKYLNQANISEKLDLKVEIDETKLNTYYHLYNILFVFASLYDLGFKESSKKMFYYDSETNKIKPEKYTFKKDDFKLELGVDSSEIKASLKYLDDKKIDEFCFYSNYIDFEKMNRIEIDKYTEKILNELVINDKFNAITSNYVFVSVNLTRCSENNSLPDKVYRRFYSIGNNYSDEESLQNINNWNNYKIGLNIISPARKITANWLRIEKIFNYHILNKLLLNSNISLKECPLCGDKTSFRKNGNLDYVCYKCKHSISIAYCNNCDKGHKKPIIWVKYFNDKFLQKSDIVIKPNITTYYKLDQIESMMGIRATTGFELEKENSAWKLKTICPCCGKKLGE